MLPLARWPKYKASEEAEDDHGHGHGGAMTLRAAEFDKKGIFEEVDWI